MVTTTNGIMAFSYINVDPVTTQFQGQKEFNVNLLMVLQTRKTTSTSEQSLVLAQRLMYYLRNLLIMSLGINEIEGLATQSASLEFQYML